MPADTLFLIVFAIVLALVSVLIWVFWPQKVVKSGNFGSMGTDYDNGTSTASFNSGSHPEPTNPVSAGLDIVSTTARNSFDFDESYIVDDLEEIPQLDDSWPE